MTFAKSTFLFVFEKSSKINYFTKVNMLWQYDIVSK